MAKKRASLTGRGVEDAGKSEEKGKGIDLLFGGVPEAEEADTANLVIDAAPEATEPDLEPPPPALNTLPVNEADTRTLVDELGLPVAMETPPADLDLMAADFAEMPVAMESPPTDFNLANTSDLADMPVAMETPPLNLDFASPMAEVGPTPVGDIPGGMGEADLIDEPQPALDVADDLAGIDLADLSEPVLETPPMSPVSPAPVTEVPFEPATPPPPISTQPIFDFSTPAPFPDVPAPVTPTPMPTPSTVFGPATATPPPAPSITLPRARIESISGIVSERIQVVEKDILPEDTKYSVSPLSGVLTVADRAQVERDELITQRVTRYIGRERRENLDKEIERLYDEVATELSTNNTDTEFALRTLSQAQDIIFEDARQYDEALYRVAVVRTMIVRKRNLRKWSYTWGTAVFFYAVIWLAVFIAGFLFTDAIREYLDRNSGATAAAEANAEENAATTTTNAETQTSSIQTVRAAWFSMLAGGIGGVIGILYSLYWRVAMKQDFDRQYVMYYAVQPIMGFILGALMYFIIMAGFLLVNFASQTGAEANQVLSAGTVIALQIVAGFIAGFRQRFVLEMLDKIVKRFSGRSDENESSAPASLAPTDSLGNPFIPPLER